jgi:hypothetical protein
MAVSKGSRGVENDLIFEEVGSKQRAMKDKKRDPYDSTSSDELMSELSEWEIDEAQIKT